MSDGQEIYNNYIITTTKLHFRAEKLKNIKYLMKQRIYFTENYEISYMK